MDYNHVPYYLTYGMDDTLEREMENSRDLVYIRRMYPKTMVRLQGHIDDACDQLEYDGSFMFDQYPDNTMMYRLRDQIYEKAKHEGMEDNLKDIISVMLCNEMFRRRMRRRMYKR